MTTDRRRSLTQDEAGIKHGFRSGLEKTTAASLSATGVAYTYEKQRIEYVKPEKSARYTPDFVITTRPCGTPRLKDLIIETKGRFLTADRQKHLLIKRQHPDLDIRFVFNNPRARISKQSKTTYAAWCEKHGFQYAKSVIPHEWLEE